MKKMRYLSVLLILAMALSLTAGTGTAACAEEAAASPKVQLQLIASQIGSLKQSDSANPWYYTVTDLDHNGQLEFIAASQHPADRSTNLKVWTVSRDGTALTECTLDKAEDESFPDIMTDTVNTYHVKDTDTWYYMVNDNVIISDSEVYSIKTAVRLKDGVVGYDAYAVEHTVVQNGWRNVSYSDISGIAISAEQFSMSGDNMFAGAERSNTAFEWLTADKIGDTQLLTESYEVFLGTREPTETFPVPKPAALGGTGTPAPQPTVTPAPAPVPAPVQPIWLTVTKNPTNENRKEGDNAIFVACSNAYESLNWTFVSPDGGRYSPQSFIEGSGAYYSGEYSTTLTVYGVESWMNGWGVYCTFYYQGQTASTSTAYIYVRENAPAPAPQPVYGSMSGVAYEGGGGFAIYLQNGTEVFVDGWLANVEGQFYEGCSAIVYYTDYPSSSTIYRVDIFGNMGLIIPDYTPHTAYNPDGSTYDTVTCPVCGREVSMAYDNCPYCGHDMYSDYYDHHIAYNADGSTYETVTCPGCWHEISAAYEICPFCGYDMIYGEIYTMYNPDGSTYDAVTCPECGYDVSLAYENCPNCGHEMN